MKKVDGKKKNLAIELLKSDENGILAGSYQKWILYLVEFIKELKEEIRLLQEQQKK